MLCADAVIVTATEAFTATQQALGALAFFPLMNATKVGAVFPDPAGCIKGGMATVTIKDLYFRQMRCAS